MTNNVNIGADGANTFSCVCVYIFFSCGCFFSVGFIYSFSEGIFFILWGYFFTPVCFDRMKFMLVLAIFETSQSKADTLNEQSCIFLHNRFIAARITSLISSQVLTGNNDSRKKTNKQFYELFMISE